MNVERVVSAESHCSWHRRVQRRLVDFRVEPSWQHMLLSNDEALVGERSEPEPLAVDG